LIAPGAGLANILNYIKRKTKRKKIMKFTITGYYRNGGFNVEIAPSNAKVNYQGMPEKFGEYNWHEDAEVFESLPAVKRYLRGWVKEDKMSAMDRRYRMDEIRDLNLEDMVDDLLDSSDKLNQVMSLDSTGWRKDSEKAHTLIEKIVAICWGK
jgi:hypothetical protein